MVPKFTVFDRSIGYAFTTHISGYFINGLIVNLPNLFIYWGWSIFVSGFFNSLKESILVDGWFVKKCPKELLIGEKPRISVQKEASMSFVYRQEAPF